MVGLALECADRAMDVDAVVTLVAERTVFNDDVAGIVRDVDGVGRARNQSSGIEPRDAAVRKPLATAT
jgi:hypothetical protein